MTENQITKIITSVDDLLDEIKSENLDAIADSVSLGRVMNSSANIVKTIDAIVYHYSLDDALKKTLLETTSIKSAKTYSDLAIALSNYGNQIFPPDHIMALIIRVSDVLPKIEPSGYDALRAGFKSIFSIDPHDFSKRALSYGSKSALAMAMFPFSIVNSTRSLLSYAPSSFTGLLAGGALGGYCSFNLLHLFPTAVITTALVTNTFYTLRLIRDEGRKKLLEQKRNSTLGKLLSSDAGVREKIKQYAATLPPSWYTFSVPENTRYEPLVLQSKKGFSARVYHYQDIAAAMLQPDIHYDVPRLQTQVVEFFSVNNKMLSNLIRCAKSPQAMAELILYENHRSTMNLEGADGFPPPFLEQMKIEPSPKNYECIIQGDSFCSPSGTEYTPSNFALSDLLSLAITVREIPEEYFMKNKLNFARWAHDQFGNWVSGTLLASRRTKEEFYVEVIESLQRQHTFDQKNMRTLRITDEDSNAEARDYGRK